MKNLLLTAYGSLLRKALELTVAPLAELLLSKERILELYLNVVEWGPGVFGAEAAAQYHYGISARRLSRGQAARLAACLPAPRTRIPQRMDHLSAEILDRMESMDGDSSAVPFCQVAVLGVLPALPGRGAL
jgi:monofunctional biosynthetic peptidoglycan transglycosylase